MSTLGLPSVMSQVSVTKWPSVGSEGLVSVTFVLGGSETEKQCKNKWTNCRINYFVMVKHIAFFIFSGKQLRMTGIYYHPHACTLSHDIALASKYFDYDIMFRVCYPQSWVSYLSRSIAMFLIWMNWNWEHGQMVNSSPSCKTWLFGNLAEKGQHVCNTI